MRLVRSLFLALVLTASAPLAAQPVAPSGDPHEQLGTALALGAMCKTYRPFELRLLGDLWRRSWNGSDAYKQISKSSEAVNVGPMGFIEAGKVRDAAERKQADSYRQRAATIGCEKASTYIDLGRIEVFRAVGTEVALAVSLRGQVQVAPGMTALTTEERSLIGLFGAEAKRLFGAELPVFEQQLNALVQRRMAEVKSWPTETAAAILQSNQVDMLGLIHADALFAAKAFAGHGAILDDGTAFGVTGARLQAGKGPVHWVIAGPAPIIVPPLVAGNANSYGHILVMLRADGAGIIGIYGRDFENAALNLTAAATNSRLPPVAGVLTNDCPVTRCYLLAPAEMKRLIPQVNADTAWVKFFVGRLKVSTPNESKMDDIEVRADRLDKLMKLTALSATG